jgi:predicted methyltransferase
MNRLSLGLGVLIALTASPSLLAQTAGGSAAAASETAALDNVLQGSWRDPANVARDVHRHPRQTLTFFGIAPQQTVIEITPGGGWYAEIQAPYLRDNGRYVAAVVDPAAVAEGKGRDYQQKNKTTLESKFAAMPAQYGKAQVVGYDPKAPVFGPADSADLVLTFRNVHN